MTNKGKMVRKTLKFLTDNEMEVHGHSVDVPLKPEIKKDGCKVGVSLYFLPGAIQIGGCKSLISLFAVTWDENMEW